MLLLVNIVLYLVMVLVFKYSQGLIEPWSLSHVKMIEVDILCDDACSSDTVRRDVWSVVCCMAENSVSFWCLETLDFTIAMYT